MPVQKVSRWKWHLNHIETDKKKLINLFFPNQLVTFLLMFELSLRLGLLWQSISFFKNLPETLALKTRERVDNPPLWADNLSTLNETNNRIVQVIVDYNQTDNCLIKLERPINATIIPYDCNILWDTSLDLRVTIDQPYRASLSLLAPLYCRIRLVHTQFRFIVL